MVHKTSKATAEVCGLYRGMEQYLVRCDHEPSSIYNADSLHMQSALWDHEAEGQGLDAHVHMLAEDEGMMSALANWLSAMFPFIIPDN